MDLKATNRVQQGLKISNREIELHTAGITLIAGVDEAGRGPLAGPVVAAAVILPLKHNLSNINDSKLLTPTQREIAYNDIMNASIAVSVAASSSKVVDRINILQATLLAMRRCVQKLKPVPEFVLIDGNKVPEGMSVTCESIVGGDSKILCIAAASIIAKVTRDRLMVKLDRLYPQYGFASHKGYAAPQHFKALKQYGPSPHHRYSFSPIRQKKLFE